MLSRLRSRLTFANVTSCAALFVALGGSSYAAITVGSGQIKNHSIQDVDIATGGVTSEQVKDKSLKEKDFGTGQVSGRAIKNETITDKEIAAHALTAEVIKRQSLTADLFKPGQIPAGQAGQDGQDGHTGAVGPTTGASSTTGNPEGALNGANAPSSSTSVNLPTTSKLLIQGEDTYFANCGVGENGPASIGLYLDGVFVPGSRRNVSLAANQTSGGSMGTMGVVSNVSAGTHTVSVASLSGCAGSSGSNALVSAIALGG